MTLNVWLIAIMMFGAGMYVIAKAMEGEDE